MAANASAVPDEALRIDVWLWRARLAKTRAQAAAKADQGLIRLRRDGRDSRIDKASRPIRPGDELTFAIGGRVVALRVLGLGVRRGPAAEAQLMFETVDDGAARAIDNEAGGHR